MQQQLPDGLRPLEREMRTYYRELPNLLDGGNEGRYALIRSDELIRVCETLEEADLAGHELFGLERFMAQRIRRADLDGLAPYFGRPEVRVGA